MPEKSASVRKTEKIGSIAKELIDQLKDPLFSEEVNEKTKEVMISIASSNRECLAGQVSAVMALTTGLISYNVAVLLAEMGTGKTQMSIETIKQTIIAMKGEANKKALFLTVGKLMGKMTREVYEILGKDKVEVYEIINSSKYELLTDGSPKRFTKDTKKVNRYGVRTEYKKGDLIPIKMNPNQVFPEEVIDMVVPEGKILIYMISKDSAKNGLQKQFHKKWGDRCDECGTFILPKNYIQKNNINNNIKWKLREDIPSRGVPLNCPNCGDSCEIFISKSLRTTQNPIFANRVDMAMNNKGIRKTSVGQKFRRQLEKRKEKKIFDIIVVDEVHEMQSPHSIQGKLYRDLVNVSKKALIMTGTLSNGYPSSIFYILQGVMPNYLRRQGFKFYDVSRFVDRFGALKHTRTSDVIKKTGSATKVIVNELPKISEGIISLLVPFTYWLKMEDLNLPMPAYREDPYIVEMEPDVKETLDNFKNEVISAIKKYDPKRLKSFAQRFVYLQNNPTFPFKYEFETNVIEFDEEYGEEVYKKKNFSFDFKPVSEERVLSKELKLISYIKSELIQGRNVMVYSIFNKAAHISKRLGKVISENIEGIAVKVMPESVGGDKIEPWIIKNPCDVLICSPLKVSTGLDLVQFPSIAFYETGTNLRTVQQASRRSWRAFGQDFDVKISFFAYQGIQAHLLDLIGKKLKGAAIVEGRVIEGGQLASIFDDDTDFTEALNNIAKDIEEDIQPDFSSSIIEKGKLRPNTVFEQAYIDILSEIKGSSEIEESQESFKHNHEEKESVSEENQELIEEINQNLIDIIEEESIIDIKIDNSEISDSDIEIKVACKCENKQLTFDF